MNQTNQGQVICITKRALLSVKGFTIDLFIHLFNGHLLSPDCVSGPVDRCRADGNPLPSRVSADAAGGRSVLAQPVTLSRKHRHSDTSGIQRPGQSTAAGTGQVRKGDASGGSGQKGAAVLRDGNMERAQVLQEHLCVAAASPALVLCPSGRPLRSSGQRTRAR